MVELKFPIYLDHHATTPVDPRVLQEMLPYFSEKFGNASSIDHSFGYDASVAVEIAREKIANAIGARHEEIIFTSGATESDNLAMIGTMEKYKDKGNHLITCVTEHKAILDTARYLETIGKKVTYLPVSEFGEIDLDLLKKSITDKTVMISIMAANNEIGTIAEIEKIGNIVHDAGVIFHTDAAQAVGHIPMNVEKMNIDLMSMSAHKMYGPKGVGALYIRSRNPRVKPDSIMFGGGQERNIRSGTLNVPGIVGFGKAFEIASEEMNVENERFKRWSLEMFKKFEEIGGKLNGHPEKRLSHNLNVFFKGVQSKAIINSVSKKISISAGSACTTQIVEPSHVILALGYDDERAHSSIRIGLGRLNTKSEIEYAQKLIMETIENLSKIKI
jgi:cysteine desulfurase